LPKPGARREGGDESALIFEDTLGTGEALLRQQDEILLPNG
jgi:hypothetical protein